MPRTILIGDIVRHGLNSFGTEPQTWRVTHHMKRREDRLDARLPVDGDDDFLSSMQFGWREEERRERQRQGKPADRRYTLDYCRPEEATHVCLVSICGCIAPLSECEFVEVVGWTPEHILADQESAVSAFWLSNEFPHEWTWEDAGSLHTSHHAEYVRERDRLLVIQEQEKRTRVPVRLRRWRKWERAIGRQQRRVRSAFLKAYRPAPASTAPNHRSSPQNR